MARGIILLLRLYQLIFSPLFPPSCRFYPTCSSYAMMAYHQCGIFKGTYLVARRLLKCHPFHPGGVDPVR